MSDIVERLRKENASPPYYDAPKIQVDAAAEITALRAEVARLREALWRIEAVGWIAVQVPGPRNKLMEICDIARAALAQKEDVK